MSSEDFTPNLGLPYLLPNQAQKHVTVNESLAALDGLAMASIESRNETIPPIEPGDGLIWIVPEGTAGDWIGQTDTLAWRRDGAWQFITPQEGWRVWDRSDQTLLVYQSGAWQPLLSNLTGIERLHLGLNGAVSAPFAAELNTALWTAAPSSTGGNGDLRLTLNKEASANTASLIFQSNWVGHCELGLAGDTDFSLRTSPDGQVWTTALHVDAASGHIGLSTPATSSNTLTVNGALECISDAGAFRLRPIGLMEMSRELGKPLYIRGRSDGSPLSLGATNSSGTALPNMLTLRPDNPDIITEVPILPDTSGQIDLGDGNRRFRDLYLTNPPSVSSDARDKTDIDDLTMGFDLAMALRPVQFRRHDQQGLHFGFLAQEVENALRGHGLSKARLWRLSDPRDPDSRQSLRQEDLIAVLTAAVQALHDRLHVLEQRQADGGGQ
ncbi:MAG: DUF2793 domain-containing protein [Pseudomonadota bacterium]